MLELLDQVIAWSAGSAGVTAGGADGNLVILVLLVLPVQFALYIQGEMGKEQVFEMSV